MTLGVHPKRRMLAKSVLHTPYCDLDKQNGNSILAQFRIIRFHGLLHKILRAIENRSGKRRWAILGTSQATDTSLAIAVPMHNKLQILYG